MRRPYESFSIVPLTLVSLMPCLAFAINIPRVGLYDYDEPPSSFFDLLIFLAILFIGYIVAVSLKVLAENGVEKIKYKLKLPLLFSDPSYSLIASLVLLFAFSLISLFLSLIGIPHSFLDIVFKIFSFLFIIALGWFLFCIIIGLIPSSLPNAKETNNRLYEAMIARAESIFDEYAKSGREGFKKLIEEVESERHMWDKGPGSYEYIHMSKDELEFQAKSKAASKARERIK